MILLAKRSLFKRSPAPFKKKCTILTFLCLLAGGLQLHAQDCSELKILSDAMYSKLIKYDTTSPKTDKLTAEYKANYTAYKTNLFAYIDKTKYTDAMLVTAAQIILRDETVNYMIEMKKLGDYEKAYSEFLFSKKMISDNIVFDAAYRHNVKCGVGDGKEMVLYSDDYREKNAMFYAMGADLADKTNRPDDAVKYFMYLHNNDLFGAWHTHLNPIAEMIFQKKYAAGIINDTCFFAAFHFLETYKDRNIIGFFNTETRDHAISIVLDKKFEKLQVSRSRNPDDDKFYDENSRYFLKLYAITQPDSLNFSDEVQTAFLTRLLKITNNAKKGIPFNDFYQAFIARGGGDFMTHAQKIIESRNAELIALMADFFYEYRKFNTDIAVLAALFYIDRGNKQMTKKSLKDLKKNDLIFYREHYPRLAE